MIYYKQERARLRQKQREIEKKRKLTLQKKREEEAKRREEIAKRKLEGQLVIPQLYLGTRLCAQNWEWLHEAQTQNRLYYILNVTNNVPNYYETGLKPSDLDDIQEDLLELQKQICSEDEQIQDEDDKENRSEECKNNEENEENIDLNINDWNEEDLFEKLEHLDDEKKLEILEKFKLEGDSEEEDMEVEENDETETSKPEDVIEKTKNKLLSVHDAELKFVYKRIPIEDSYDEDISRYFDESVEFINNSIEKGDSVLVHCREGRSRSVAIIIAYLMIAKNWTLQAANDHMASIALDININNGFKAKLMELELKIHNKSTLNYFDKSTRVQNRVQYNEDSFHNIEPRTRNRTKKNKKKVKPQVTTNEIKVDHQESSSCDKDMKIEENEQVQESQISDNILDDMITIEEDILKENNASLSFSTPNDNENPTQDKIEITNEPNVDNLKTTETNDQPSRVESVIETRKLELPKKKSSKKAPPVNLKTKQFWESFLLKTN